MSSFLRVSCVVVLAAGCSKKEDKAPPGPSSAPKATAGSAAGDVAGNKELVAPSKPEPPPEARKGASRVVNLLVDEAGAPMTVDVWGKRSFEWGPTAFAKGVAYGQVTPHFGIPKGMSTVVVPAGGSVDDRKSEVGSVWASQDGEEITTVVFRDGSSARSIVMGMKPEGVHNAPAAPAAGKGLVYLYANPLRHHETALTAKYGGSTFYVGDGSQTCLRQRVEDKGQQPALLGGTNTTTHEVAPGKVKITLHKWEPGKNCTTPPVFETEVEVAEGKGTFVIVHSPDAGASLAALQLPMWK